MDDLLIKVLNLLTFDSLKRKKKPSIIKNLIDNPEKFKMEAWIENDEIVIKLKHKEVLK